MTNPVKLTSSSEVEALENQAISLCKSQKYKEAITIYKQLLQLSNNPLWQQSLAECYLRRAENFALKGMHKEALVLWENYRQFAEPPYQQLDRYIVWQIQAKQRANIQSSLKALTAEQLDNDYPELAAILGALILTGHIEFQQALPQDSIFIDHLSRVLSALQALRDHDHDGVNQQLKQLPYRSAFRDFRTLLKALLTMPGSIADANLILEKIPTRSPYSQAAQWLRASSQTGAALVSHCANLGHAQRKLLADCIGLNKLQIELLETLSKQKQPWPDKLKFNLALNNQSLLGSNLVQSFCFALLSNYPAGQRDFDKAFGAIDEFEQNRLKALGYENADNHYDADFHWRQCIKALSKQDNDNGLKIALIYRHMAQGQPDQALKIQHLCNGLEYDPSDKASYLQILAHYQKSGNTSAYKDWLNKALSECPEDIDILMQATQAATANRTYKKAIQYAEKILKIDPVNSYAKQLVFTSHLNHARRLLKTQKLHLVAAEIQRAENLKLGKTYALQTDILRGLLGFAKNDKSQLLQLVVPALNKLNPDPATAHFQATMEALLTDLPVAPILRELPKANEDLVSAPALNRLIALIELYAQDEDNLLLLHKALDKIKAPLKKSLLQKNYPEKLQLSFCQALYSIQHFELMRPCAKSGQSQWQKPLWFFYKVYSETNGDATTCSFVQRAGLQINLDDAYRDKDFRAQNLIGEYLDAYHAPLFPNEFEYSEQETTENFVDPIYALFGHLPDKLFEKIDLKADMIARKTPPDRLLQEVLKISGAPANLLTAMQNDPDLFNALLLLKAANDLKLDIEVTAQAILEHFGLTQQTA